MSKFRLKNKPPNFKLTDDEIHIDFVKTNLSNCRQVILDAETCNKGRYSHSINSNLHRLKSVMERIEAKKPIDIDREDVVEACRYMRSISSDLWLANTAKKGVSRA